MSSLDYLDHVPDHVIGAFEGLEGGAKKRAGRPKKEETSKTSSVLDDTAKQQILADAKKRKEQEQEQRKKAQEKKDLFEFNERRIAKDEIPVSLEEYREYQNWLKNGYGNSPLPQKKAEPSKEHSEAENAVAKGNKPVEENTPEPSKGLLDLDWTGVKQSVLPSRPYTVFRNPKTQAAWVVATKANGNLVLLNGGFGSDKKTKGNKIPLETFGSGTKGLKGYEGASDPALEEALRQALENGEWQVDGDTLGIGDQVLENMKGASKKEEGASKKEKRSSPSSDPLPVVEVEKDSDAVKNVDLEKHWLFQTSTGQKYALAFNEEDGGYFLIAKNIADKDSKWVPVGTERNGKMIKHGSPRDALNALFNKGLSPNRVMYHNGNPLLMDIITSHPKFDQKVRDAAFKQFEEDQKKGGTDTATANRTGSASSNEQGNTLDRLRERTRQNNLTKQLDFSKIRNFDNNVAASYRNLVSGRFFAVYKANDGKYRIASGSTETSSHPDANSVYMTEIISGKKNKFASLDDPELLKQLKSRMDEETTRDSKRGVAPPDHGNAWVVEGEVAQNSKYLALAPGGVASKPAESPKPKPQTQAGGGGSRGGNGGRGGGGNDEPPTNNNTDDTTEEEPGTENETQTATGGGGEQPPGGGDGGDGGGGDDTPPKNDAAKKPAENKKPQTQAGGGGARGGGGRGGRGGGGSGDGGGSNNNGGSGGGSNTNAAETTKIAPHIPYTTLPYEDFKDAKIAGTHKEKLLRNVLLERKSTGEQYVLVQNTAAESPASLRRKYFILSRTHVGWGTTDSTDPITDTRYTGPGGEGGWRFFAGKPGDLMPFDTRQDALDFVLKSIPADERNESGITVFREKKPVSINEKNTPAARFRDYIVNLPKAPQDIGVWDPYAQIKYEYGRGGDFYTVQKKRGEDVYRVEKKDFGKDRSKILKEKGGDVLTFGSATEAFKHVVPKDLKPEERLRWLPVLDLEDLKEGVPEAVDFIKELHKDAKGGYNPSAKRVVPDNFPEAFPHFREAVHEKNLGKIDGENGVATLLATDNTQSRWYAVEGTDGKYRLAVLKPEVKYPTDHQLQENPDLKPWTEWRRLGTKNVTTSDSYASPEDAAHALFSAEFNPRELSAHINPNNVEASFAPEFFKVNERNLIGGISRHRTVPLWTYAPKDGGGYQVGVARYDASTPNEVTGETEGFEVVYRPLDRFNKPLSATADWLPVEDSKPGTTPEEALALNFDMVPTDSDNVTWNDRDTDSGKSSGEDAYKEWAEKNPKKAGSSLLEPAHDLYYYRTVPDTTPVTDPATGKDKKNRKTGAPVRTKTERRVLTPYDPKNPPEGEVEIIAYPRESGLRQEAPLTYVDPKSPDLKPRYKDLLQNFQVGTTKVAEGKNVLVFRALDENGKEVPSNPWYVVPDSDTNAKTPDEALERNYRYVAGREDNVQWVTNDDKTAYEAWREGDGKDVHTVSLDPHNVNEEAVTHKTYTEPGTKDVEYYVRNPKLRKAPEHTVDVKRYIKRYKGVPTSTELLFQHATVGPDGSIELAFDRNANDPVAHLRRVSGSPRGTENLRAGAFSVPEGAENFAGKPIYSIKTAKHGRLYATAVEKNDLSNPKKPKFAAKGKVYLQALPSGYLGEDYTITDKDGAPIMADNLETLTRNIDSGQYDADIDRWVESLPKDSWIRSRLQSQDTKRVGESVTEKNRNFTQRKATAEALHSISREIANEHIARNYYQSRIKKHDSDIAAAKGKPNAEELRESIKGRKNGDLLRLHNSETRIKALQTYVNRLMAGDAPNEQAWMDEARERGEEPGLTPPQKEQALADLQERINITNNFIEYLEGDLNDKLSEARDSKQANITALETELDRVQEQRDNFESIVKNLEGKSDLESEDRARLDQAREKQAEYKQKADGLHDLLVSLYNDDKGTASREEIINSAGERLDDLLNQQEAIENGGTLNRALLPTAHNAAQSVVDERALQWDITHKNLRPNVQGRRVNSELRANAGPVQSFGFLSSGTDALTSGKTQEQQLEAEAARKKAGGRSGKARDYDPEEVKKLANALEKRARDEQHVAEYGKATQEKLNVFYPEALEGKGGALGHTPIFQTQLQVGKNSDGTPRYKTEDYAVRKAGGSQNGEYVLYKRTLSDGSSAPAFRPGVMTYRGGKDYASAWVHGERVPEEVGRFKSMGDLFRYVNKNFPTADTLKETRQKATEVPHIPKKGFHSSSAFIAHQTAGEHLHHIRATGVVKPEDVNDAPAVDTPPTSTPSAETSAVDTPPTSTPSAETSAVDTPPTSTVADAAKTHPDAAAAVDSVITGEVPNQPGSRTGVIAGLSQQVGVQNSLIMSPSSTASMQSLPTATEGTEGSTTTGTQPPQKPKTQGRGGSRTNTQAAQTTSSSAPIDTIGQQVGTSQAPRAAQQDAVSPENRPYVESALDNIVANNGILAPQGGVSQRSLGAFSGPSSSASNEQAQIASATEQPPPPPGYLRNEFGRQVVDRNGSPIPATRFVRDAKGNLLPGEGGKPRTEVIPQNEYNKLWSAADEQRKVEERSLLSTDPNSLTGEERVRRMALAYPPEDVPQKAQAYPDQRTKLPDFVDKSALPDFKGPALTAEEIAQKNAARPWRERFAEKAWDLGETPISFEGLRDFGRSLLQKGNEPILSGPDSPLASGKYGLGDDMDILGAKLSPWMIPLMFASSMGKDLEKGDYTGAAKHGAESAGIFYLLRKLGEAAQKPLEVIKGVPGELGGITGFTYKPAAEGALSDFLPRNWRAFGGNAGVASLAHNAINRYFGVTGGLQAAGELWDDKGAPATELFDQYGTLGIGARKAAAIGAAALGLIPEAGMALGLGVDVGRNLLDPFARRLGSGQWGMEDPAAFGGAKEGMLPDSVLREEAASAFNKAEQALHERNDHAAYKNTIEGLTNALMQRGYSKENINNLYGEVRPGLRSMPGWMGTKGIDMTDVDPTQFAPGAFERYMLHRTQNPVAALENPLAVALAQKQSQQQAHDRVQELLHQAQQAQLGPTAPPPVLNLGGFRPSLPSGADPRFDPAGLLL